MMMATSCQRAVDALAQAMATAVSARIGGAVTAVPGTNPDPAAVGWTVPVTFAGAINGAISVWCAGDGLAGWVKAAQSSDAAADHDIEEFLRDIVKQAAAAVAAQPVLVRTTVTAGAASGGQAAGSGTQALTLEGGPAGPLTVLLRADVTESTESTHNANRLEAVMDVDLPLIVRFGSAKVPLKTLAGLAAGALVDLNRAPDDPVDLLIGERVIARGEVVVVDGHYGVRIVELTGAATTAAAVLEA